MCGIIGIIGKQNVAPLLVDGLRRLEYRGYDSAGIATLAHGEMHRQRAEGKLDRLDALVKESPIPGTIGIGHTRWATHGAATTNNAHPHATAKVAVVHNGIIENYAQLREELAEKGYFFQTDTDTEVIPHLITYFLDQGHTPHDAVAKALGKLEGAFALGILFTGHENLLIGARRGSPLAVGYGEGEMYLGSDAYALAPFTSRICYLEEGDWVEISRDGAVVFDHNNKKVERQIQLTSLTGASIGKGNYRHFMLKEVHEQPVVLGTTLNNYFNTLTGQVELPPMPFRLADTSRITIVACGTSYYAGMVAKYWFEQYARIPVDVDIASEFRYRHPVLPEKGVALFISQSGETADTLAALRLAKTQKQTVISLVNVPESTMARESDVVLPIFAGPEIGVASTKAYTTQLMVLACLSLAYAQAKNTLTTEHRKELAQALLEIPGRAAHILQDDSKIERIAQQLATHRDILYMGRGTSCPIAMEGALKLKELSYIHAEAVAAGELKHGPIALVDKNVPVVVLAPSDGLFEKTASNVQEVAARGGKIILVTDQKGASYLKSITSETILLPAVHPFISPILYVLPMQLLAYHVAVAKGTDVDQPRNLAKSVTVE